MRLLRITTDFIKVFGGGWFDNVLPSVGQWAKTGVGRYVVNAAGEGLEEVGAELADPLAKTIYKGKDALEEYKDLEYWKGVGKAGLSGAAISGIYGGAFDAMGGGVKAGDIRSVLEDIESIKTQAQNRKVNGKLTAERAKKADSQTLGDLRLIEKTLKSVDENKRAELIKNNNLSGLFDADGTLNADFAEALSKDSIFDRRYYSENRRGFEKKIEKDLQEANNQLGLEGDNVLKVYDGELDMQEQAKYSKIQRLFSSVNKRSGANVGFVLLDENAKINGRINQKEDLIYISKDNLTNGNWAGTVVHELTHFAEGTEEYNKLVNMLLSDENTFNSAIDSISKKVYNFSLDGLSGLDSNQAVRYNRKYNILWNKLSSNEQAELYSRIDALHHQNHKESKLPNGNCFIETENKIVETDADFDSPSVESVVEFSKFSGKISQAKGLFYEYVNNGRTIRECVAIINEICQEEVAIFYGSDHSENYRQLPRQGRDNSNTRQNIRNGRHGGRNTSTNRKAIRYHFNDDGSTEVTYSDGSTEIKHSLKDGTDDIAYGEFLSELNAHMSEIMFGNEAFVDRVIRTDAPLAEKILGKISDLKEAFGRIGDPEAQAQHKRLVEAEKMYLNAIEAAGKKYENGKIISVYDDEDEGKENIVQTKYSFAGEKAQTADNMSLENAQRMLAGGIDSEIIRKETGWFKGYDGKWRFEIDDGDAYLVENPKFENRNDGEGGYFKVAKLGDVFTHDALYKAYPELKDYTVVIQDTETGTEGMTFLERKQIVLSKTLFERITKEYNDYIWGGKQKEIAEIEATPEYLEMDRYYDDDVIEEMDGEQWLKETELARDKFFSSDLGKRYYKLKWGDIDIRKFEPGWSDKAKMVLIHEIQHAIQHIEGFARGASPDYWARKVQSGYDSKGKTPGELYGMTAGEVEARDAGNRVDMTAEQRKNTRPDIDRSDVVFADLSTVSMDVATDNHGHQVVVLYKDVMANQSGKPHQIIANLIANHIGDVYSIIESGQKVYIGEDLPNEYTQSEYTKNLLRHRTKTMKVKNQIVQNFGEVIEIATNRRWEKTKHTQNKDAKYGFYRYKSRCALPSFDRNHNVVDAKIYNFELLIRNASDGRKYLYDIVEIKKETSSSLSQSWIAKMDKNSSRSLNNSISQFSEKSTSKGKFSFKEESSDNKNTADSNESKQSDNKNPTSYTKAEAEAMVDGIMESIFSFDGYHGEIKNRADVIRQAHAMLNSAEAGKRHSTALKFADYIIQHTALADSFDYDEMSPYIEKVNLLKPYLHRLNLESIEADIKHHYDKDRSPFARWAVKKGARGLGGNVMAQELEVKEFNDKENPPTSLLRWRV